MRLNARSVLHKFGVCGVYAHLSLPLSLFHGLFFDFRYF